MKYLIVKTSSLGDIIHAFTAAHFLKSREPNCIIDWVAEKSFVDLVKTNSLISRVYPVETKLWRKGKDLNGLKDFWKEVRKTEYDAVFDLQGNSKSALITLFAKSKNKIGFASQTVPEWPNLLVTNKKYNPPNGKNIREDYLFLLQSYFNDFQIYKNASPSSKTSEACRVLVAPGSAWKNKQITEESLVDFLELHYEKTDASYLFIWGNELERIFVESVSKKLKAPSAILDKMSLKDLRMVIEGVQLVISMDSMPLHLAGVTATPTLSFFGPSLADKYKPLGDQHIAVQGACPYGQTFEKRCPKLRTCPTGACLRSLSGQQLYNLSQKCAD